MNLPQPFDAPQLVRLRIADFELLHREGAFADMGKVELIEGAIVRMNAELSRHTVAKNELMFRLRIALKEMVSDWSAFVEPTLALPPHNLPEPDIMVARVPNGVGYFGLTDIAIVIEVSNSSLRYDLGEKARMYAANGVPEYWVVDLDGGEIHQFWRPEAEGFADSRTRRLGDPVTSTTMSGLTIDTDGL